MSFLLEVISELEKSSIIKSYVDKRMRLFVEPTDTTRTFIILSNITPDELSTPVSNNFLSKTQYIQIDVQSPSYDAVSKVSDEVRKIMIKQFNLKQDSGGLDDYFEETNRYIISRRFIGVPIKNNYKEKKL